jgi:hydrogenase-4 component F
LVSLYRTKEAIEASWKYFILCIIGIALALFGTILVYFAADEILWSNLITMAAKLDPVVIKIAFIFLLVGYGTKIGLAPLHNWLPDTYSHSPAPVSALLSGLLSTASLYALIRFKIFADLILVNNLPGNLMMFFGLLSFIVAAIMLQRQQNIKRLFAYSSIEHMGLITFIFGLGGAYVGLFYILMHSLIKSAIFVILGNIVQQTKTKVLDTIRGLINSDPKLGWTLLIATLAIAGMPPFGIFTSELMLVITCMQSAPLLTIILFGGFILVIYGIWRNIQPIVLGPPTTIIKAKICLWPAWLHLLLAMVCGVYVPPVLRDLLQAAAGIIV